MKTTLVRKLLVMSFSIASTFVFGQSGMGIRADFDEANHSLPSSNLRNDLRLGQKKSAIGESLEAEKEIGDIIHKGAACSEDQGRLDTTGFYLSPNPAITESTVEYQLPANSSGEIVVTNILGVKQASYTLAEGNNRVSIGKFPTGTYFVTMMVNGEAVQTQKLILQ